MSSEKVGLGWVWRVQVPFEEVRLDPVARSNGSGQTPLHERSAALLPWPGPASTLQRHTLAASCVCVKEAPKLRGNSFHPKMSSTAAVFLHVIPEQGKNIHLELTLVLHFVTLVA